MICGKKFLKESIYGNHHLYVVAAYILYERRNKARKNFIRLKIPNSILTFIPLGAKKESIPIEQISSVSVDFKLRLKNFLIGILMGIIGLFLLFGQTFLIGLILLILGASNFINSFQTELVIDMASGKSWFIFFLIFEKRKAEQAKDEIENLISRRYDATDVGIHTEKQTAALVDAITGLKKD